MNRAPIPDSVRAAVVRRANGRCEDCGERDRLELHHLRYWREGEDEPIFGTETAADLDALCRGCHHARHVDPFGYFWSDPVERELFEALRRGKA